MIDGTEKPKTPSKFAKRTARYNEFGSKYLITLFHYGATGIMKQIIQMEHN